MLQVVIHRPAWLRPGVWPLALIAFGAGYFATGDAEAKLGFYTITAQVVRALFIALAVQIQAFMRRRPRAEDRHAAVVTALALVLAEYECLDVVASGDPTGGGFSLVVGALAAASVGLALPVLLGPEDESMAREPDEPEPRPLNWKGLVAWAILLLATRSRRR